jgi:type I restriction enzyme, S subunit
MKKALNKIKMKMKKENKVEWKEVKLGDVAKVISGYAFKSIDFIGENNIPAIKIKNIKTGEIDLKESDFVNKEFLTLNEKYHVVYNDILISLTGSHLTQPNSVVGRVGIYKHRITSLLNQRAGKIIPNLKVINQLFLYSFLSQEKVKETIALKARGAANQANISPSDVEDTDILLPPLTTQTRIAAILSTYDDLIENNLQRIKLLEEIAQRTYQEWFVKFREYGVQLEVGENGLPEGWERKRIGECCMVGGGGTPSRLIDEYWLDGEINWYSPTDLSKSNTLFQIESSDKITDLGLRKSSAKLLEPNSFMMTSRATIGLFAIVDKPFSTNQGFINISPFEMIEKEYLLYNFKNRIEEFKGNATGTTFLELSKSNFKSLEIIWPNFELLNQFNKIINNLHQQIISLTHQNRHLKTSRDILLPKLMSGVLEV